MRGKKAEVSAYVDRLCQAILLGASYGVAAAYAGLSHDTFLRWRKDMVHARLWTPLATLRERLSAAEGQAAMRWLGQIEQAAQAGDWRASAWKLSKRWPADFGEAVSKVALTDPSGEQPWQPNVIALPWKAPSIEEWTEQSHQAFPQYGSSHGSTNGQQP
jgi:hypothetical protein